MLWARFGPHRAQGRGKSFQDNSSPEQPRAHCGANASLSLAESRSLDALLLVCFSLCLGAHPLGAPCGPLLLHLSVW